MPSLEGSRGDVVLRWVTLVAIYLATVFLCSPFAVRKYSLPEVGDPVYAEFRAQTTFSYESPELLREWEEERRRQHDQIYVYDAMVETTVSARMNAILSAAGDIGRANPDLEDPRLEISYLEPTFDSWSIEDARLLVKLSTDEVWREMVLRVLRNAYLGHFIIENKTGYLGHSQRNVVRLQFANGRPPAEAISGNALIGFPQEFMERVSARLRDEVNTHRSPEAEYDIARELLRLVARPNLVWNAEATRKSLADYPRPDMLRSFERGAPLFRPQPDGTPYIISHEDRALLEAHAAAMQRATIWRMIGHFGYVGIVFALVAFYIRKFGTDFTFDSRGLLLTSLPTLLALATSYFFIMLGASTELLASGLFPAGVVGMLGVLLLGVRMSLLLVTWSCLLYGLQADLDYTVLVVSITGGYTAVAALHQIRERREVLLAGLSIACVNFLVILLLDFISSPNDQNWMLAFVGAVAGFSCALITISSLPVFEVLLDVTTDLRLLELSGLEHPLLKRLEEEAPGTWQHTLNVAKLAEGAASAIGANVLLVRAGVYFHDIGKMTKPEYFTENQTTLEDKARHVTLKPQISTLIVKNHVKEGVEIARKAGLPQRIIDFIPQHHGTSLIQFFYQKSLAQAQGGQSKEIVRENDYRYPGPKPQTIEAAVVMMADSVEATSTAKFATRTVREDEVQQLVRSIINDRFNDEQFDECSLTMENLTRIRDSFVKTLLSRYHTRVDYPKLERPTAAPATVPGSASKEQRRLKE